MVECRVSFQGCLRIQENTAPTFVANDFYRYSCYECLKDVLANTRGLFRRGGRINKTALLGIIEDAFQAFLVPSEDPRIIWYYDGNATVWKPYGQLMILRFCYDLLGSRFSQTTKTYILEHIQSRHAKPAKEFPRLPKEIIPVKNGFVDYRTKELVTIDPLDYFFTSRHPIIFDPQANDFFTYRAMRQWVATKEEWLTLVEFLAYCFYRGYPLSKFLILEGFGANGKTTYLQLIERMIGTENVASVTLHDLTERPFALAALVGKNVNLNDELPSAHVKSFEVLKDLTGGKDFYRVERKFKDVVPENIYAKHVFTTNELPTLTDETLGFWRRIIKIRFPFTFDPNPKFIDELTTEQRKSALFNIVLNALNYIIENKRFTHEPDPEEIRTSYYEEESTDDTTTWIVTHLRRQSGSAVEVGDIYSAYLQYCGMHDIKPISRAGFIRKIKKLFSIPRVRRTRHEGQLVGYLDGLAWSYSDDLTYQ